VIKHLVAKDHKNQRLWHSQAETALKKSNAKPMIKVLTAAKRHKLTNTSTFQHSADKIK
jgi:hypothetical protein